MDIVADNISKLKELFPEAFIEGKVDFDALKEVLGDYIDGREERYSFTGMAKAKPACWHKHQALEPYVPVKKNPLIGIILKISLSKAITSKYSSYCKRAITKSQNDLYRSALQHRQGFCL